ncbi:MAG: hypothetical protein ACOCV1_03080 [Bacillota bacterium]
MRKNPKIDYTKELIENIWNYEYSDDLEPRDHKSITGKFYDSLNRAICYIKNNLYHRENGPAFISCRSVSWYQEGLHHRIDGPAEIYYYTLTDKKSIIYERWWFENMCVSYENNTIIIPIELQEAMIDYNVENIKFIFNPNKKIQKNIIINYPHLISKLRKISPELRQEYSHILSGEDLGI